MARPNLLAAAIPRTELSSLVATQTDLRARQDALAAEIEAAVARRRELLISGTDAAGLAEAERTCRELEGTAFGIADALAEIERRVIDCRASPERDGEATDAAVEAERP